MTLDPPRNHLHADMVENDDHPGWLELARKTEAEDRAAYRAALEERDACESVEAEESKWFHPRAGIFAQMARERPAVHYADGTGG